MLYQSTVPKMLIWGPIECFSTKKSFEYQYKGWIMDSIECAFCKINSGQSEKAEYTITSSKEFSKNNFDCAAKQRKVLYIVIEAQEESIERRKQKQKHKIGN
jgi:hypothetical protein